MTKLNQIIAVVNGKKTQLEKSLTEIYQKIQKADLFAGISREYKPLAEDGESLPPEKKLPQFTCVSAIEEATAVITDLIDSVATQDVANTEAKANVTVDGKIILSDVPVTHLLFLEKQLVDIKTFISKLPVLDPAERWTFDANVDYFVTEVTQTNRNKKVFKNHVKAEATDKHPAQVEVYSEDEKVGTWNTTKFSGCIEAKKKKEFAKRVDKLIEAVKFAREEANSMAVSQVRFGESILNFIFN